MELTEVTTLKYDMDPLEFYQCILDDKFENCKYFVEDSSDVLTLLTSEIKPFELFKYNYQPSECNGSCTGVRQLLWKYTSDKNKDLESIKSLEMLAFLTLPLTVACCSGNDKMIDLFCQKGANIEQVDSQGNNVVHALVNLFDMYPNLAMKAYKHLMSTVLHETKVSLHYHENDSKLTPLDLATQLFLPEMINAIINEENVYSYTIRNDGIVKVTLYDVSLYEEYSSNKVHILQQIMDIKEEKMNLCQQSNILNSEPFKTWISSLHLKGHVSGWLIVLLLNVLLWAFYISRSIKVNEPPHLALTIPLIIVSVTLLRTELAILWQQRSHIGRSVKRICSSDRPMLVSTFQRVTLIIYAIFVYTVITFDYLGLKCVHTEAFIYCVFSATGSLINGSIYFFSFNKYLAHISLLLQKAIEETHLFMTVGLFIYFIYATTMFLAHVPLPCDDLNSTISNVTTNREMFTTLFGSMYETFLLSLGVMMPYDIYFNESHIPIITAMLYASMLFMLLIILLNLLVALFSDKVSTIHKHKALIIKFQVISASLMVIYNYSASQGGIQMKIFKKVFPAWHKRATIREHLIRSEDGKTVLLEVIEVGDKLKEVNDSV